MPLKISDVTYLEAVYKAEQQRPLHPGLESCILSEREGGEKCRRIGVGVILNRVRRGRAKHHQRPCAAVTSYSLESTNVFVLWCAR